jgi:hypothetical protein
MMLLLSAPSALASSGCPNELVREESNTNPTTAAPYDFSLPECRAYEMVSPLEKQDHDALSRNSLPFISVSPEGDAIEWPGQGDYAGAENYQVHASSPTNPYVAQRTASGWLTRSAYPPPTLIEEPSGAFGGSGVYSPNLAYETVCGGVTSTGANNGPAIRCALRSPGGFWTDTPEYSDLTQQTFTGMTTLGASSDTEDYVFSGQQGTPFLSADTSESCSETGGHCGGIYEVAHIGTQSPDLSLVNVDNNGNMIGPENLNAVGALPKVPEGGDYQAISADGSEIFFTATPTGGVPTIYARVNGKETVAVSNPSPPECTICNDTPMEGRYQGASANGENVFFTTEQQLLNSDTDDGTDLYEYDFGNSAQHLVQISGGGLGDATPGSGANVQGVVDVSEDGSHVFFVARGVLTTLPNGLGQTATNNAENLYAYDTDSGETKFVATLPESDAELWGYPELAADGVFDERFAQATPNGRYLAFVTLAELTATGPEADTSGALQVYRYDFASGSIVRVSLGHEGFSHNGNVPGFNAIIGPGPTVSGESAASPTVNDSNRAISENGGTVAFVSAAQLQSTDVVAGSNGSCNDGSGDDAGAGCEVYVWHECPREACVGREAGEVNMISDGQDAAGAVYAGMSATGSDIFFQTDTQLVGQDTDHLGDIYDARIDGGFPAPAPEPSCAGEACQGTQSPAPTFGTPSSQSFTGGGNQTAPPFKEVLESETKPKSKPLTRAQKLGRALEACKKDVSQKKRKACERAARAKYGKVKRKK